jgi:imidazolonepropionase-like amidohydrolase
MQSSLHSRRDPLALNTSSLSATSAPPLRPLRSCLFLLALAATAQAQDLAIKAAPQQHAITITNATIHPVSAAAFTGSLTFDKGRITAIGPNIPKPPDAIDARGAHIYPGFIAADSQLGLAEMAAVRASNDYREVGDITPEVRAIVSVNPDSTLIPVTRSNGVLTAAIFPEGGRISGRVGVIRLTGWTWEEMAVKADAGLAISWPSMRPITAPWMETPDTEQQDASRKALAALDEAFKTAAAYNAAKRADPSQAADLRWEAMRPLFAYEGEGPNDGPAQLPVFIAAADSEQITAAVTWAVERKLRPVIVGGRDAEQCAELLKRHDVPVIITGTHAFPKRADSPYDDAYTLPARLAAAGVRFAIASADRTAHERNLPYNAGLAIAFGLSPDAALKSVTLWPAQILGVDRDLGSLEVGKAATLFVASGDPLDVTTTISGAYIDGREIDLSNKQTKLADKYREKYRQKQGSAPAPRATP